MKEVRTFIERSLEEIGIESFSQDFDEEESVQTGAICGGDSLCSKQTDDDLPDTVSSSNTATGCGEVQSTISSFMEEWTQLLCSGSAYDNTDKKSEGKKRPTKKSLLRTLEARMMADQAGAQLLMLQDRNDPNYRDRLGATEYPHLRRLRSSYL